MNVRPETLGELRSSPFGQVRRRDRSVKQEMRENLLKRLRAGEAVFDRVLGYSETVVPHIVNAILSRHHMILLGLRGQAKSRLLRQLADLLDPQSPIIAGCEINDNPFRPICSRCRALVAERGDATPVGFRGPEERYVEKLATPDVTIADMIGDIDPIKAAKGGHALASASTMHYGLLPRANRGIFAINELPDLAAKIQVGLFNVMQEGDVQIKGYPVRLPIDVVLVFSANPEDYTARGKIVTPLKDRIGSEIHTHYPPDLDHGVAITELEAWTERDGVAIPRYIREVVEGVAFKARGDERVDKRSGVSQRLPISCLENVASNAERRRILTGESRTVARIVDVYAALPAITGKLELEYEGELKGVLPVARDLIRQAVRMVFRKYVNRDDFAKVTEWFDMGGTLKYSDLDSAETTLHYLEGIQGLMDLAAAFGVRKRSAAAARAAAAEFVLEGLYSMDKISRTEELGYSATEKKSETPPEIEDLYRDYASDPRRYRKKTLN